MTLEKMIEIFNANQDEFLKFNNIKNPQSRRPDLNAFMLFDFILPGKENIVTHAENHQIFLSPSMVDVAKVITEEQIIELVRSGIVIYDDCFSRFS